MIVYVVTTNYGYDCNEFEAVFSTKEKAEKFIEKHYGKNSRVADWCDIIVDEREI